MIINIVLKTYDHSLVKCMTEVEEYYTGIPFLEYKPNRLDILVLWKHIWHFGENMQLVIKQPHFLYIRHYAHVIDTDGSKMAIGDG